MNKRIKEKRLSKQIEYILAAVGYIFYLTSLIEYNLVQLISAEKYLQVFDKKDISYIDIINAKKDSNKTLHDLTDENRMLGRLITLLEKTQSAKDHELLCNAILLTFKDSKAKSSDESTISNDWCILVQILVHFKNE